MKKLKPAEKRVLSNFFSTIAVGWFTAGIISPFFIHPQNLTDALLLAIVSIALTLLSLGLALYLARGEK